MEVILQMTPCDAVSGEKFYLQCEFQIAPSIGWFLVLEGNTYKVKSILCSMGKFKDTYISSGKYISSILFVEVVLWNAKKNCERTMCKSRLRNLDAWEEH